MKTIDWSKWSSVAEITSSIAILITLIYLAIQTKQNTEAVLANTNDTVINTDLNILNTLIANPNINVNMGDNEITIEERQQLINWVIALLRTREHQWFQYKNGVLEEQAWESYLSGISFNLSYPRTRHIWDYMYQANAFNSEFSEVVNDYLNSVPLTDVLIVDQIFSE